MANRRKVRIFQVLLLAVALMVLAYRFFNSFSGNPGNPGDTCRFEQRDQVDELIYVDHARCRMKCREINAALVEDVYLHGQVNCNKGSVKNGKARYALEKRDQRGDMIRVIIEDDDGQHVVITAIRLDRDDKCACS
jgi:hypothetical protein